MNTWAQKISTFFLFNIICLQISNAQVIVYGTIKRNNGIPLENASVTIQENGKSVTADNSGNYTIDVPNQPSITSIILEVYALGYEKMLKIIELTKDSINYDFILKERENSLEEIVVTATNNSRRIQQEMPISISSFNESKLQKIKFNSNADILRGVPGIAAEGGGGEVAANIFIRGLPSSGQYQFSPLQIDGMPVVSTMGINSSSPDVYFRNDAGFSRIEFVRGGSATLYGAGSVAGIINFTSKTGGETRKSIIETEYATPGKAKFDFNTSGPIGNKLYYNVAGTYRYDNGPIKSGIASNGYQLRGNVKSITKNGSVILYAQYIKDQVQFYSPYHLTKDRTLPTGWNGEKIHTMLTPDVVNLSVKTPNGFYQSRGNNIVRTNGVYIMGAVEHNFENDWKISVKLKTANYKHEFNLFNTDGNKKNPLNQTEFLTTVAPTGTAPIYTYASDNAAVPSNALILENTIVDRNRPLNEIAGNANITKTITGDAFKHTLNLGVFLSNTNATDYNVQVRYLSEFNKTPRILNLKYTNASLVSTNYTINGVVVVPGYVNKNITSKKSAVYITDEMSFSKLNVDIGFRMECHQGNFKIEKTFSADNSDGIKVAWGNGSFDTFKLNASDWAVAVGASYQLKKQLNVYVNFSRGYFFPEYRGYSIQYKDGTALYPKEKPEHIIQGEIGFKFINSKLRTTLAGYLVNLNDRVAVDLVSIRGVLKEAQSLQSSKAIGIEFTYDWEIVKYIHFAGTGTMQKATYSKFSDNRTDTPIDNRGKWIERQPAVMFSPSLSFDNKIVYASFNIDYVGKRFSNADNIVELYPYTLARVDVAYIIKMKNDKTLRIGAGMFNIFNSEAVTEGNPRSINSQTNTSDFFVGRISLPRALYTRMTLNF